jgi:hypothetical protein
MKKIVISALLAAALVAPLANASMVSQWTVGTYTRFDTGSVTSTGGVGNPGITIGSQSLSWGTGGVSGIDITQGGNSGDPANAYQSTPVFTNGAAVDNVIITHRNQPITGNTLTSVDILSTLYLTPLAPAGSTVGPIGPVTFAINFAETDNGATPCANGGANGAGVNINGCADIFVIDQDSLNFAFLFTDPDDSNTTRTYYLSFFERTGGFTSLPGAACAAAGATAPCLGFMTPENQNTPAQFAVTITSQPITIPEPGTLALLGIALTGLGLVRGRRNI